MIFRYRNGQVQEKDNNDGKKIKFDLSKVKCYNCDKMRHVAINCRN